MEALFKQINRYESQNLEEGREFSFILPARHQGISEKLRQFREIIEEVENTKTETIQMNRNYKITVKKYMTEPASIEFSFHDSWNNGNPMPLCIMEGKAIKETRGMIYMELTGKASQSINCMCCGRKLSNPVSKLYGIGPECSNKVGISKVLTEEEAFEKWKELEEEISNIKWSGWVIKKAIKSFESLDD